MSDTNATPTPAKAKIYATLKKGRYYDYNGKVWDNEKAIENGKKAASIAVTEEEEAYLRENAVIEGMFEGQPVTVPLFTFSASPDDETPIRKRAR